jgi:integrase
MADAKVKVVYVSFRRTHPQMIFIFKDGRQVTTTLPTLRSDNEKDRQIAKEITVQKNRQIALEIFNAEKELPQLYGGKKALPAANEYIKERQRLVDTGQRAPGTIREDTDAFKLMFKHMGDSFRLSDVDENFLKRFVRKMQEAKTKHRRPYRPESINKTLRTLAAAFTWFRKEHYIKVNPFVDFERLEVRPTRDNIRLLTHSERQRFEDEFNRGRMPWHVHAFRFALFTLCRAGSILRAKHSDIFSDMIDGEVTEFITLNEKRNKTRTVILFPEARAAVDAMKDLAENSAYEIVQNIPGQDYKKYFDRIAEGFIFFPLTRVDTVSHLFYRAARRLGIDASIHDLRDTGATLLLENGVPLETVSYMLGHSSVKTTEAHYTKITRAKQARDTRHLRKPFPE